MRAGLDDALDVVKRASLDDALAYSDFDM